MQSGVRDGKMRRSDWVFKFLKFDKSVPPLSPPPVFQPFPFLFSLYLWSSPESLHRMGGVESLSLSLWSLSLPRLSP